MTSYHNVNFIKNFKNEKSIIQLVENQREFFKTGKTAELEHRRTLLKRLRRVILENKEQLCDAVYRDLKRHPKINYTLELSPLILEIDYMLDNLEVCE